MECSFRTRNWKVLQRLQKKGKLKIANYSLLSFHLILLILYFLVNAIKLYEIPFLWKAFPFKKLKYWRSALEAQHNSREELCTKHITQNSTIYLCFFFPSGLFLTFGCSGIVPAIHFMAAYGVTLAHRQASVGWMALMGVLYIAGAIMYATRVPERWFPGKCDIWVSSQISFLSFTSEFLALQCSAEWCTLLTLFQSQINWNQVRR